MVLVSVLSYVMIIGVLLCFVSAELGLNHGDLLRQLKVPQCREECMEKFNADELSCLQKIDCSTCDFPPYSFNRIPDVHDLLCWNSCSSSTKINKSQLDVIKLKIISMVRDGALTSADITWKSLNIPSQCLVTWEVSGGGLMGNLLTDTPEVQLTLWPDSKYRIQVTCKNKNSGKMSKSLPLLIDTSKAVILSRHITSTPVTVFVSKPTIKETDTTTSLRTEDIVTSTAANVLINTSSSSNIKVLLARHQNPNSRTWKTQAIQIEASLAICVSFLLFLVICSIFSMKKKKLSECDKAKLLGDECEANLLQTQTIHV